MSDTRDEKHLRLLPEILPAPAPNTAGTPRQRALARAARLGALTAAMASAQTGCSGEHGSGATPPIVDVPATRATGGAVVSTAGAAPPPPATQSSATTPSEPPTGPAVVDPTPPPAACVGAASTIKATASWVTRKGGGFVVEVKFPRPGSPSWQYSLATMPTMRNATRTNSAVRFTSVIVALEPNAGATTAGVSVLVECLRGMSYITADLDLSKPPAAKAAIPVTLQDTR